MTQPNRYPPVSLLIHLNLTYMQKLSFIFLFNILLTGSVLGQGMPKNQQFAEYTAATLDSIYTYYAVKGTHLFRENYPIDPEYQASYLASTANNQGVNAYSYLWPFSGLLSAQVARYAADNDTKVLHAIEKQVLPGLSAYLDSRNPPGYASYVQSAPTSDRFYDDNVWLGIDYTDLYLLTSNRAYLDQAKMIWRFVASGMDKELGGGIYWCEQKKDSKNTCSNAPAVVFLAKLYRATGDKAYRQQAVDLYAWTKDNLQDTVDQLYFDNIQLNGEVNPTKYPYNSGQMIEAASLLYQIEGDSTYLTDAQQVARAAADYFFSEQATYGSVSFKRLKTTDLWFIAVMMRGFVELHAIDKNPEYLIQFERNLDYAWANLRDAQGLFRKDWTGKDNSPRRWLLDQWAMVEMYARLSTFSHNLN